MCDAFDMMIICHAATFLLAVGFLVFFWMIFKGTKKVIKKGIKSKRRRKAAGF